MDRQGHNMPMPPFADPYLLDFAADADPYLFLNPIQHVNQPRPRRSYWADQYREMEETSNFKRQRLPLHGIKRIMKADEDVKMISPETLVIFARACEMFIIELTHKGWVHAQKRNHVTIQKNDIVSAVKQTDYCDFLVDIRAIEEPMDQDVPDPMDQFAPGPPDPLSYYSMLAAPTAIPGGPYNPLDLRYYTL
ncbi:hypothetical protein M5K25_011552 [Dendrobium thyrsiflorum]|uniref:Transcription factor CBF/NF-Y/archaeal histone domain-containing protein n=1 Tax=Dendrobium thyrsiflorum TaxID=117978 RepID=A0ABD0V331_DENTH